MDSARDKVDKGFETAVVLAALTTIPLTVVQLRGSQSWVTITLDWLIWTVFAVEFVVMMSLSQGRRSYARGHILDFVVVVVSFPLLPSLLAFARLARLSRFIRLARLLAVTTRGMEGVKSALSRRGLLHVAALVLILVVAGGGLLSIIEPETAEGSFWGGVWWAAVTATTVGYGDISPTTLGGRLLAIVLMLAGIGLVSTLAASIAAYFVGQEEYGTTSEIEQRLARIEALLEQVAEQQGSLRAQQ